MIIRENRKLIGSVKKVEAEFAVYESIDGKITETRNQSAGYSIYDFEGRLIEEVSPYRQMMYDAYKDIYFYNEKGELDYRNEYDENDSLIGKSVFEKLPDGNLKEKNYYFDDQKNLKLGSHLIYEGDNNDQDSDVISDSYTIETAYYDRDEKITPQHFDKYDPSQRIKINRIQNESGHTDEIFKFDDKGNFSHKILRVYDENSNLTEQFCYETDGTLYLKDEYIHKFDSIGNWVEKIQNYG